MERAVDLWNAGRLLHQVRYRYRLATLLGRPGSVNERKVKVW
jgi:hypothetical protein